RLIAHCHSLASNIDQRYWHNVVRGHHWLGLALEQVGRAREADRAYQDAVAWCEKLLAVSGASADKATHMGLAAACRAHARLLATHPDPQIRDGGRALDLARKAVKLEPQHPTSWHVLGLAQYRAGDWTAAVTALEKSIRLSKQAAPCDGLFFLAMAAW